jgi:hypothetical protein
MGSIGGAIAGAHRRGLSHTTMRHLRRGFMQKESGEGGDPHRKVLAHQGLCTRALDGGRSSSSFDNGIGGAPVVLWLQ